MSRIGKMPISIPGGVEVNVVNNSIDIKGANGVLSRNIHPSIQVKVENNMVLVSRNDDTKPSKSLHGMTRALINNMVVGVTKGYSKKLQIVGVGYKAQMEGKGMVLNLGYSHTNKVKAVDGVTFEIGKNNEITVKGIDKELVGQISADIRNLRKPDPYKGKGIRYHDEVIIKKVGKTGASAK